MDFSRSKKEAPQCRTTPGNIKKLLHRATYVQCFSYTPDSSIQVLQMLTTLQTIAGYLLKLLKELSCITDHLSFQLPTYISK